MSLRQFLLTALAAALGECVAWGSFVALERIAETLRNRRLQKRRKAAS